MQIVGLFMGLLFLTSCQLTSNESVSASVESVSMSQDITSPAMPTSEQWLSHIQHEIAPFYLQDEALGEPAGNFPTFRCNDGKAVDLSAPCSELSARWIKDNLGNQYTRMLSRQIYTYGVIFHMTGDQNALNAAKVGVDYLRANLLDREQGGAVSYLNSEGKPGLKVGQRTAQDLAYAQVGMSFYYYLTRDEAVLKDILAVKEYIFSHYRNMKNNQLLWVLEDSTGQSSQQLELVSQLDQINAYMLIMIPLLPEKIAQQWKLDLRWLIDGMLTHYHNETEQRFYGYIHHPSGKNIMGRHADRGHTIKAYWMIYLSAKLLQDDALVLQAESGMRTVLKKAYDQAFIYELMADPKGLDPEMEVGFWNSKPNSMGSAWWEYAELDQAAETLALKDPSMLQYLRYTYTSWLASMVDKQHGGIWAYAFGHDASKLHQWKNGYHGAEHALIAYLGAAQRENQKAALYFALKVKKGERLTPYYYSAKDAQIEVLDGIQKVSFRNIY